MKIKKIIMIYISLYSLYSSTLLKEKNNDILIFIHDAGDSKSDVNYLCIRYTKCGFITSAIETVGCRIGKDKTFSAAIKAISSAILAIKNKLVEIGFNSKKLELGIYGSSAGAYTGLLYSYLIGNKCPITLKFMIDNVDPVTMEPYAWYSLKDLNNTLEDLKIETIESSIKNGKLIHFNPNEIIFLNYMNFFIGDNYTEEQFKSMLDKSGKIDYTNPDFIKLKEKYMKIYFLYYINKNSIPTLCIYAGKDIGVSVN